MWRTNILRAAIPHETVEARSGMLFGHNTNVTVDGTVFHVQTEDRGIATAVLDTTVHCRGRVLHRRTTKYLDLLPLDADREQALKLRLDDQHRTVLEELRSGVLVVAVPPLPPARPAIGTASPPVPEASAKPPAGLSAAASTPAAAPAKVIAVEVLNPRTWLTGKHATLYLVARYKEGGAPAGGARISARVAGTTESTEVGTVAGADGHAHLEFDMPRLAHEDAALVIEAVSRDAHGQLRFQLRAKPKSPVG